MSFITGIVHALVEQDAVCAVVLSASRADRRAAAYPHSTQMRELGSEHNFQAFLRAVCSTLEGIEIDTHRSLIFFLLSLPESNSARCCHPRGSARSRCT